MFHAIRLLQCTISYSAFTAHCRQSFSRLNLPTIIIDFPLKPNYLISAALRNDNTFFHMLFCLPRINAMITKPINWSISINFTHPPADINGISNNHIPIKFVPNTACAEMERSCAAAAVASVLIIAFIQPGLISCEDCPAERNVVACYYASWGIYRPGNGTFKIEYIDPKLCTHLIYSFAGLNLDGMIDSLDYSNDVTQGRSQTGA